MGPERRGLQLLRAEELLPLLRLRQQILVMWLLVWLLVWLMWVLVVVPHVRVRLGREDRWAVGLLQLLSRRREVLGEVLVVMMWHVPVAHGRINPCGVHVHRMRLLLLLRVLRVRMLVRMQRVLLLWMRVQMGL
jgi:hypothetical protein